MSSHSHSIAAFYSALRSKYLTSSLRLREPAEFYDPIPISERLIQAVWADQLFNTSQLQTQNGTPLEILNPGRWNVENGPDFKGAQIKVGSEVLKGDIEIHLHTTGWNDHHHSLDPAYNGVILDVCLWKNGNTTPRTHDGKLIHQLVLHPYLQCSLEELAESLDPDRYPFSPTPTQARSSPLLKLAPKELSQYIHSAGVFRFEQKSFSMQKNMKQLGSSQTAYQSLASALGYKHNKLAFRQIATILPLSELLKQPIQQRIQTLISVAETQNLKMSQIRPVNHPHRRLAALAMLIEDQSDISKWFLSLVQDSKKITIPPKLNHPFWSYHYHLQGKPLSKPVALLGKSRWMEIVTNAILPFCFAQAQLSGDPSQTQNILQKYTELSASQANLASRQMAYNLGLKDPSKAVEQQGLIQIYQDFYP